jgi:hypothetical protein
VTSGPSLLSDARSVVSEDEGFDYCAVLTTGGVECWGDNGWGELGDGSAVGSDVPVAASGITNAMTITSDSDGFCAVLTTGGVDCWGSNGLGELGDGSAVEYSDVPSAVVAPT